MGNRRFRTAGALCAALMLVPAARGEADSIAGATQPGAIDRQPAANDSQPPSSGGQEDGVGSDEVLVGVIVPTTGPLAGPGEEVLHGIEVAVETWNEVKGSPHAELEVCDDGGEPERSLTCIERLADAGVDIYLGPHFGSMWAAAEQTYVDRGYFALSASPAASPPPESNAFGAGTPHGPALEMILGVFEANGFENVGFLHTTDASAQEAGTAARELSQSVDVELSVAEFANDAQTAVPQVQQLVADDAEAIAIWTTGPAAVTALRAIKDVGFSGPVTLNYSQASPATYELGADVVPDDLRVIASSAFVEGAVDDPDRQALTDAFRERHESLYGPVSWNAMGGGDPAIVALTAAANGATPDEMAAYLESGTPVPALTVTFEFSTDSHVGSDDPTALRLARLVDGQWEFAD